MSANTPRETDPRKMPQYGPGFFRFVDEQGYSYGSFEVFYSPYGKEGWYWWSCFPGCMPDGDAVGPFESAEAAFKDARGDV